MKRDFSSFSATIIQELFDNGTVKTNQTAIIDLMDENGTISETVRFAFISTKEVYEQLKQTGSISYTGCYIENINLEEYRKIEDIGAKELILLNTLTLKNCFISNQGCNLDLSNIGLMGEPANFENTIFSASAISFENSKFHSGSVSFEYTLFISESINFSRIDFRDSDVHFKNAIFSKGDINFSNSNFLGQNAIFTNADFGNGDISFENCKFTCKNISFEVIHGGVGKKDFSKIDFGNGDVNFDKAEFGSGTAEPENLTSLKPT